MNLDTANESDVREELAAPLLARLGYQQGTSNDILREFQVAYGKRFLGRKKSNDPPLRGRADYVLVVTGAGRWILEVKAPNAAIDKDAIEQALSYAHHPEISASYAAVLNGRRLVVFHISQNSGEQPLLDIEVGGVDALVPKLQGVLSPAAIIRDCKPKPVDTGLPIAVGLRSEAKIARGKLDYSDCEWTSNIPLPAAFQKNLNELTRVMREFRANISGGRVWRDECSRIRAQLQWAVPHGNLQKFADDKLSSVEYVSLSSAISEDEAAPTVFDVIGKVRVNRGEQLFDVRQWQQKQADLDVNMNVRGQAIGRYRDGILEGDFQTEYEMTYPLIPGVIISMFLKGRFSIEVDRS